MRQLGFNICLGTDSLASNQDLNLFEEMRSFRQAYPDVSPHEIMEMVTTHPARALGHQRLLGRISEGAYADLIALDHTHADASENVVTHEGPVNWLMVNGEIPGD